MITAWMLYSLLLGVMLAIGALLADRAAVAARLPRRFAWMGALTLLIVLTALAPWRGGRPVVGTGVILPEATVVSNAAAIPVAVSMRARVVERLIYPTRYGIDDLSARVPESLDRAIGALWLIASAASLFTLLSVLRKLDRQRRTWPHATIHGQRVRVASQHGPAVYGVLHPEIVLPSALLARTAKDQQLVLTHEEEHRRARDPLVLSAAAIGAALIPWHPVAWWMASRLRLAVELDCDARVIRRGASPRMYGELLLALSESLPSRRTSLHALTLLDSPRHLERRLLAMTSRTSRRTPFAVAGFLLAGGALVTAACSTEVPTAAQIRDADATTVAQTLGLPAGSGVRYVVDGVPVTEAEAKRVKSTAIASITVSGDSVALRGSQWSASGEAQVRIVTHGHALLRDAVRETDSTARVLAQTDSSTRLLRSLDTAAATVAYVTRRDSGSTVLRRRSEVGRFDSIVFVMDTMRYTELRADSMNFTRRPIEFRADSMTFTSPSVVYGAERAGSRDSTIRVVLGRGAQPLGGGPLIMADGVLVERLAQPASGGPLIVVDGVVIYDGVITAQILNQNDIQTIEVLKGPAAVGLFGSRAESGAIVITTKRKRP